MLSKELHNFYTFPIIIRALKWRVMRVAGREALLGLLRIAYTILTETTEGKRELGRHRHRWVGNIKIYL
jgi:hypothetical protein